MCVLSKYFYVNVIRVLFFFSGNVSVLDAQLFVTNQELNLKEMVDMDLHAN
jgi:hypothetical protein